ncbi:hypothetical protein Noda2021_10990 [Candidatus Dependentiae bacterium Noda2021]|nr:hypothetical protein Noda2021_10990 [Candidatus Dependentiae bacterium Noda2021]
MNVLAAQELTASFSKFINATSERLTFVNRLSWTPNVEFELEPGEVFENKAITLQAETWPKIASFMIYSDKATVAIMDIIFKKLPDHKRVASLALYHNQSGKISYNFADFTLCAEKKYITYLRDNVPAHIAIAMRYNGSDLISTQMRTTLL